VVTHKKDPIGACVFLSDSDLQALNVDLEAHDVIEYRILEVEAGNILAVSGGNSETTDTTVSSTAD
jgi:hypothetical protein